MEHTESSVRVFFTREYARFKTINGNRQLNELKIKRIMKDISEGLNVLKYCPVIVTEKNGRLEIIDGQHRFYVAKKIGENVWYIVSNELSLLDIARINSNTDKWKDADFINCYVQQGNTNYEILRDFQEENGFPLSSCLLLLERGMVISEGGGTAGSKHRFRQGQFAVKQLDAAKEMATQIQKFKDFDGYKSGAFIEAICRIIKAGKISVDDLLVKFLKEPTALAKQSNGKEYLNALEVIYNKNERTRKVIW